GSEEEDAPALPVGEVVVDSSAEVMDETTTPDSEKKHLRTLRKRHEPVIFPTENTRQNSSCEGKSYRPRRVKLYPGRYL
ncbi:MAG: hypothetical protein PHQ11_12710, partial [Paludibacter sp.]|nr:hypothetical protein [Paludibacter sp.]